MTTTQDMIKHTENWVSDVIVKYNICPFARREVERGSIRYALIEESKKKKVLQSLLDECRYLDEHSETETTLFIMPRGFEGFYAFLDLVDMANDLLDLEGYEGVYQLANFHPDYCFADEPQSEPSNYTNRSPYPTLHIIREKSMEMAINNHPDVDAIPERNVEFANKKGNNFFATLLASCLLNK
ncbi:DUF1415 domain-containing protein [Psychromonas sp. Urea-02u-13]|uniref:DUF1415 domain-containing protein n=1 Tax=Psychromonas sp. Urea-02u-13 TaxID=2058326 RepID=UPI000C32624F|nr:DUF1415 domain-containing protein [Psychromonas sp. Urea-02u-13]PKG40982.1 DUF1415 domain-containing protein [Psychromonas sp. Urea-02u-13]